ncbi:helix-turn-helix domain-containing protein [Hymenobacter lucidus]|uniref:Helix-turn-helix transcriptional regulator n=1 Tax=Hymenobacter lucidus TaxID=2880930 RepID=A0ABS8AYP2_9BACT|nr:helix-turn-helix transcriptional regulator [Hymenobacter lucidus]
MPVQQQSPFLHELARRLKAVREERHLTLQEVYDATGIHVSRLESGRRNVALLTVAMLCRYYQVALGVVVTDLEHLLVEGTP